MQRLGQFYIDIPALRPGTIGAYALAFLFAGAATALRLAIDPYVAGIQFITFFPAVVTTTLISGFRAGVFCTMLSAAAADLFVIEPRFSFYVDHPGDVIALLLFVFVSLIDAILVTGMRFAVQRYREQSVALRESQDRLASVVAELQHRTRNLISVVGTMAKGTLRKSETFDEFSATFQDRLEVLGRAQGLLFRAEVGRVTFDELINTELAAQSVRVGKHRPVTLDGPKGIPLRSRTVQSLAMALHELMTNATKYGALKQPNGHLTVRWRQETMAETGKPWLLIDWKESGVEMPPLGAKPQGSGQGRELIERVLPYQFDDLTRKRLLSWSRMAFIAPSRFPHLNPRRQVQDDLPPCSRSDYSAFCRASCLYATKGRTVHKCTFRVC
jgi:two-component sensor histidine kinase